MSPTRRPDVVCSSHLPWSFIVQRPRHLLLRGARTRRVFSFEGPVFAEGPSRLVAAPVDPHGVCTMTPHLPAALDECGGNALLRGCVDDMVERYGIADDVLWYETPTRSPPAPRQRAR